MEIDEIKHPQLKTDINLFYMYEENNDLENLKKTEEKIIKYLNDEEFIVSYENNAPVRIPHGLDGNYLIPVFSDKKEYEKGMEYFRLNDMDKNKTYKIEKLKKCENPKFLGYFINIASSSFTVHL